MEVYEAIEKRRTIRVLKKRVSEGQLRKIILAGTKAPSAANRIDPKVRYNSRDLFKAMPRLLFEYRDALNGDETTLIETLLPFATHLWHASDRKLDATEALERARVLTTMYIETLTDHGR